MRAGKALDDEVDDLLGDPVGHAQVGARDDHEADDDAGGLRDLAPVGPLDALELGPGGAQELKEAGATGLRRMRGLPATGAGQRAVVLVDVAVVVEIADGLLHATVELGVDVVLVGLTLGAADQRGLELLDLAGGMVELARDVLPVRLGGVRTDAPALAGVIVAGVSIRGHADGSRDLAGLPVARVRAAPLAELAQGDAIRRVALGLVGLVIAPLALLAGEGHSDAHVSAGHEALPCKVW